MSRPPAAVSLSHSRALHPVETAVIGCCQHPSRSQHDDNSSGDGGGNGEGGDGDG